MQKRTFFLPQASLIISLFLLVAGVRAADIKPTAASTREEQKTYLDAQKEKIKITLETLVNVEKGDKEKLNEKMPGLQEILKDFLEVRALYNGTGPAYDDVLKFKMHGLKASQSLDLGTFVPGKVPNFKEGLLSLINKKISLEGMDEDLDGDDSGDDEEEDEEKDKKEKLKHPDLGGSEEDHMLDSDDDEGEEEGEGEGEKSDPAECERRKAELFKKVFKDYIKKRSDLTFYKLARAYMHVKSQTSGVDDPKGKEKEKEKEKGKDLVDPSEEELEEEKEPDPKKSAEKAGLKMDQKIGNLLKEITAEENKDLENIFLFLLDKDKEIQATRYLNEDFVGGPHDEARLKKLAGGLNKILKKAKVTDQKDMPGDENYQINEKDLFILKNYLRQLPDEDLDSDENKAPLDGLGGDDGLMINILRLLKDKGGKFDSKNPKSIDLEIEKGLRNISYDGKELLLPGDNDEGALDKVLSYLKEKWSDAVVEEFKTNKEFRRVCGGDKIDPRTALCGNFEEMLHHYFGIGDHIDSMDKFIEQVTSRLTQVGDRKILLPNLEEKKDVPGGPKEETRTQTPGGYGYPWGAPPPQQGGFMPPLLPPLTPPRFINPGPSMGPMGTMEFFGPSFFMVP